MPARAPMLFFQNQDLCDRKYLELSLGDCQRFLPLRQFRIRWRIRHLGISPLDVAAFLHAAYGADLVVAAGGGYLTDLFELHASLVLSLLGLATQLGKPTAMFGQGLGPMASPKLLSKARSVLPLVNLIALRECRVGPGMLASFGVSSDRVAVTGDDVIEPAYGARPPELGTGIGINLRVAAYSEVESIHTGMIRTVLHDAARRLDAPLVPLPISSLDGESDVKTLEQLLHPQSAVNGPRSAVGSPLGPHWAVNGPRSAVVGPRPAVGSSLQGNSDGALELDTPHRLFQQVGRCRLVVTGSYHGGVFALSQGIPVVCVAKSMYYVEKFLGLADQFASGCSVVLLNDTQFPERLAAAIDGAWVSAEQHRPLLLEAARRQIDANQNAYRRLFNVVTSRHTPIRERL